MLTDIGHDSGSGGEFILCDLIKNVVIKVTDTDFIFLQRADDFWK